MILPLFIFWKIATQERRLNNINQIGGDTITDNQYGNNVPTLRTTTLKAKRATPCATLLESRWDKINIISLLRERENQYQFKTIK